MIISFTNYLRNLLRSFLTTTVFLVSGWIFAQPQYYITGSTSSNLVPRNSTANMSECIYYPSDFPTAPSGFITKLYIGLGGTSSVNINLTDLKIMMGRTTLTQFATGPLVTAGLITVFYSPLVSTTSISYFGACWIEVPLEVPFFFDNTSDFILLVTQNGNDRDFNVCQTSFTNPSLIGNSSSPTGTLQSFIGDIGFDLMPMTAPNDAGISAITNPVSPILSGTHNIKVTMANYGLDTLTSAFIGWSVNGVLQTPYSWSGALLQQEVDTGILLGAFSFPVGSHNIKAWSYLPNGTADTISYNDTASITVTSCNLLSGTYTIGVSGANYPSFSAACSALLACGVNGSVTFNVMPGTYNEQLTITPIQGASLANRVTFQSSNGDPASVVLTYSPTTWATRWVVRLNGADFISFINMTIKIGSTATNGHPLCIENGADYNLFQGDVIETHVQSNPNFYGIYNSSDSLDQHNFFIGNTIIGGYFGVYWYGKNQTALEVGNVFEGNTIRDWSVCGLESNYQDGIIFTKNNVTSTTTSSGTIYGVRFWYCDNGIQVTKNRLLLSGTGTNYILDMFKCDGTTTNRGLVANNFISYVGTSTTATVHGMNMAYNSYQNIYHNSVYLPKGSTSSRCIHTVPDNVMLNIRNNIFCNTSGGYAFYNGSTSTYEAMDFNNLFSTGPYLAYWNSNVNNLAAWQSATLMDSNSVSMNPLFITPAWLYPLNFAMDNKGTPILSVPNDIDGKQRSQTTPDIGAAEYSQQSDDAGVTVIHSPATPIGPGTYGVSVSLKNFGISNLTSVKLNWKLDTLPVQTQLWVGNLAPDSTYGPQSIGNVILTYGMHTFKAWTSEPNNTLDGMLLNDTLTMIIKVCDIMCGTYTVGDSTANYLNFTAALNAMMSCGINDTVIFNVKPGTYNEQLTILPVAGVSSSAQVIFQSLTGKAADVILTYTPTSTAQNWVVKLNEADYFTFRNITIKVGSTAWCGYPVYLENGSNHNVFEGNVIETIIASSSNFYGIYNNSSSVDEFNSFIGNTIIGGYYSVYWYGSSSSSLERGNSFEDNTFKDWYYSGPLFYYQDGIIFHNNVVTNAVTTVSTLYGPRFYYCDNGIRITNNDINLSKTGTNYLFQLCYSDGTATNRGLVANNIIRYSGTGTGTIYGMYLVTSTYQDVWHNTCHIASGSTSSRNADIFFTTSMDFRNNILTAMGGGYTIYSGTNNSSLMSDYNDLYTTGAYLGYWNSNVANLVAWQTASALDSNSVSIDPAYHTPALLIPSASALDDKGTPVGVLTDYYGISRDPVTPDVGAIEWWDPLTTDLGMLSWDYPSQYACGLGTNEAVKVSVYNNSISAQSGFVIKYSIDDGVSWVLDTITTPIAIGDTVQYTFTKGGDFTAYTIYNCKAAVVQQGDLFHLNNMVSRSFSTQASVTSFPMAENIESFTVGSPGTFTNGWTIEPTTGFRWQVNAAGTATASTGPAADHTFGTSAGKYVYTEADGGITGNQASLIGPCLDLSNLTAHQVRFWYHMFGYNIDKLSVDVAQGGVWHNDVHVISGQQQTSETAPWQMAVASMAAFPNPEKIRFRVTRGVGAAGDVAVDDINIEQAPAYEAGILGIDSPEGGCDQGTKPVTVRIQNKGASTINGNLTAYYQLGTSAPVSQAVLDSIPSGDTLSFNFTTPVNLAVLKDTNFKFTSYVVLTGDAYAGNDTAKATIPSLFSPLLPIVSNKTIYPGNSATLVVQNADINTLYYWYDVPVGGIELAVNDTFITPPLYDTTHYYVEASGGEGQGNLTTSFTGNYGQNGNMFDLVSNKPITIDSFYINASASSVVKVYYKVGTYVGYETNAAAWTLLGSASVTATGMGGITKLFVGGLKMTPNQTYGLYVVSTTGTIIYNPQTVVQNFTDGTLTFTGGVAVISLFGTLINLRLWNGTIFWSSGNGCVTARVPDTVFAKAPVVVATAGMDTTICAGDTAQLHVSASGGIPPYTYLWSPAASLTNSTIANPKAFPTTNTSYSVKVTDQNNDYGIDGLVVSVTPVPFVSMPPLANICVYWPAFALAGGSPAGGTYSGAGVSAGMFNPAAAGVGTHAITYSFKNPTTNCTGHATQNIFVDACVGIEEPAGLGIQVYPNPASEVVNIEVIGITEPLQLKLMNIDGQTVYREDLSNSKATVNRTLDVSKLSPGVYYLRLEGDRALKVEKLVIV